MSKPVLQAGALRDLRIGLEVSWLPTSGDSSQLTAQEFDVSFTDGKRLFIVECKAGNVLSEDVYRLQNSIRNYGGVEARGILVAAFPPPKPSRRRLQSAKNLSCWAGGSVPARLAQEISAMTQSRGRGA